MNFLDENLLLNSELAIKLYNNYAKDMPIIDYHSHLSPQEIAENKAFFNLTELWLKGDHYKWRLMRNCGVEEQYITGNASDKDKFLRFAACLPSCIGNSIYIWCHLELKKYFGLNVEINSDTASEIYEKTKKIMKDGSFSAKSLIKKSNVTTLCTTDDPIDNLEWHKKIAASDFSVKVYPTFRPDKAINIDKPGFENYLKALTGKANITLDDILSSLTSRLDYFVKAGCFITDHALDNYTFNNCSKEEASDIVKSALSGSGVTSENAEKYKTFILLFLSKEYSKRNMAMQLHLCCQRNNNTAMFNKLGPDTGFDSISNSKNPYKLAAFLDALSKDNALPKTIVYSLDPNDDKVINTIINCFQGQNIKGKIQHGSAWWFNDTRLGMEAHLKALSEVSVIGNFIGMLTDSRSFTSYVRHDYFRRILCNHIANIVNLGEYPCNHMQLEAMIKNISYFNAMNYFNLI